MHSHDSHLHDSHRRAALALTVVGAALAVDAAVFGSRLMLDSRPFSVVGGTASQGLYNGVLLLALVALVLLLPALGRFPGRDGRTLPRWSLGLLATGAILDACTRFDQAFMVPYLSVHSPDLLDESPASALMVAMVTAWVVFDVALIAFGVLAFRRRVLGRPAAVLVAAGGALIPVAGPFAVIVVGAGLAWAGASILRRPVPAVPDAAVAAIG